MLEPFGNGVRSDHVLFTTIVVLDYTDDIVFDANELYSDVSFQHWF